MSEVKFHPTNFITNHIQLRKLFNARLCLKKKKIFIQYRNTPSLAIVNRTFTHGKFLKKFKLFKKYFLKHFFIQVVAGLQDNNNYLKMYNAGNSFKNTD